MPDPAFRPLHSWTLNRSCGLPHCSAVGLARPPLA